MKGNILKKVLCMLLIIVLTMVQFIFTGYNAVQALYEELEQQNTQISRSNVSFDAYFKKDNQNTHSKELKISEGDNLFFNINIKNTGSLNDAKIVVNNANFKIKADEIKNQYVKSVENNVIYLNQIIYGNNAEIQIPIEFEKTDKIATSYFNMENNITLSGKYKETSEKDIEKTINTRTIWTDSTDTTLTTSIEKYFSLGEEGVLLQQNIVSTVNENKLPKENEKITVTVPVIENEKPKEIVVVRNENKIEENNFNYNKEQNILEIQKNNTINENQEINWNEQTDTYKVIYLYDSKIKEDTRNIDIDVKSETKLFTIENVYEKQEQRQEEVTKRGTSVNINGTISSSVYKGYLYANSQNETIYSENYNVEISQVKTIQNLKIGPSNDAFVSGDNNIATNGSIYYKSTKINKNNMLDILGEEGNIKITNVSGIVIGEINKDTQTTETGDIIFNYNEVNIEIIIETSKPVKEGTLNIENQKAIKSQTGYSKEQLRSITTLKTSTAVVINDLEKINSNEMNMELLDTKTEATLSISNNNLTTLELNRNVEIIATLKTPNNQYDLYKNATVEIQLPAGIEEIKVNSINKKFDEELEIQSPSAVTLEDGRKAIRLKLQGEQTNFSNTSVSEGLQIIINANITFSKTIPTNTSKIIMNYTNENGKEQNYQTSLDVNVNSKYGMMVYSKVSGYNEENDVLETFEDKTLSGNLDTEKEEKTAQLERDIINNYDKEITDISIVGRIPEVGEKNVDNQTMVSTFITALEKDIEINNPQSKVYYSEQQDIALDSGEWQEKVDNIKNVRSYKIVLPENKLQPGETLSLKSNLEIPENLSYNQKSYETMSLGYTYEGQVITDTYTTTLSTAEGVNTDLENTVVSAEEIEGIGQVEVHATSGGAKLEENQSVYEGQAIQYTVVIKNTTEKNLENIKLKIDYPNGNLYDEVIYEDMDTTTGEKKNYTYIEEKEGLTSKEFEIEQLDAGDTTTVNYQLSVKENVETIEGNIKISADGVEERDVATTKNEVKEAEIKATVPNIIATDLSYYKDEIFEIYLNVKNISDKEVNNAKVSMNIPTSLDIESIGKDEDLEIVNQTNGKLEINIKSIEPQKDKSIKIEFNVKEKQEGEVNLIYNVTIGENNYTSNITTIKLGGEIKFVTAEQTANISNNSYVQTGDKLTYTITVKNNSQKDVTILRIIDSIPYGLVINKVYYISDGKNNPVNDIEEENITALENFELKGNETIQLVIETTVDENEGFEAQITNSPDILVLETGAIEINDITHILKNLVEKEDNKDNKPNKENNKNNRISGAVWQDANKNGAKDSQEQKMSGVTVKLLNSDLSEKASTKTDAIGEYSFNNIENGQYIVEFEYDTVKYTPTIYKANGISEEVNSDINVQSVNGKNAGITDIVTINNNSISGLNAGLVENKTFDLRLDKYVSKVIVQNSAGTKTISYEKEKLAKVEIDAKKINGSTVIVEYRIDVTNEGEIAGYANEIIDYMPSDMKFSSELNKTWYAPNGSQLKNTELTNNIINPGETKSITLVLTKSMTENNTGTTINTAEIAKSSNDLNIKDVDSTENNNKQGEDDISTAEVLISVRTGVAVVIAISTILITLIAAAIVIYIIRRKEEKVSE